MSVPWLILPVVICLSQRLSHACLNRTHIYYADLAPHPEPYDCWRLEFSDRPLKFYTPVGGAIDLGTFRTRLETRTKESSMCASHWDS
ncbi:hypothetical protein QE152_g30538 [Popillia japonica]|uniref:Secreted protein n=1 Tax=Popillia japonica TaxID=7064 RepID=A0AAW1JEK4_POPJA